MSIMFDPEFWWDPATQTIKFYAHFEGHKIHCAISRPALETFGKLHGMAATELQDLFQEHRREIEARAAAKIRTHRYESRNKILIRATELT